MSTQPFVPETGTAGAGDLGLYFSGVDEEIYPRRVRDKLDDIPSVLDFLTDTQREDVLSETGTEVLTTEFQAAIDADTKYLRVPAGKYLTGDLSFPNDLVLIGDGQRSWITENGPAGSFISITAGKVVEFRDLRIADSITELTIASGAIHIWAPWHTVDTQSDASSDDLDTINGGKWGRVVTLFPANDARTVVVKNGAGNISLNDGDCSLSATGYSLTLIYYNSTWYEIARSPAPSGAGETNTASNQGAGVGLFAEKSGVDLEFRSLVEASNRISITLDGPNDEIDIDVNQANLVITESQISDLGSYLADMDWVDPVDGVIRPDADGTRDFGLTGTRFATGYFDDLNITTNITVGGNVDGRDVSVDGGKLDNIEAFADVTDTANVTSAGALMDSEVDADIKTLSLPANVTISSLAKDLLDDTTQGAMQTTLGVDPAGTDNSTDVSLAGALDYLTIAGQVITRNAIDLATDITGELPSGNLADEAVTLAKMAHMATDSLLGRTTVGTGDVEALTAAQVRTILNVEDGADVTDTTNVTSAGALMDSEVDADLKTLSLPANVTITSFAKDLLDDADAATMRATLDVDQSGTDNSTDVTLAGTPDYITIAGQVITRNLIDLANDVTGDLPTGSIADEAVTLAKLAHIATDSFLGRDTAGTGDVEVLSASTARSVLNVEDGADVTDTANVTSAGALMDSEVDADLKTLSLPANVTITSFAKDLLDDADAATMRTTLDVDQAGTDNSTDVSLAGAYDYLSLAGQVLTLNQVDLATDVTGNIPDGSVPASAVTQHESALEAVLDHDDLQGVNALQHIDWTAHDRADTDTWQSSTPIANAISTSTAFFVEGTTPSADKRVFLGHFGLTVDEGDTHSDSPTFGAHKVALYAAVDAVAGAGDVWAFNTVTTLNSSITTDLDSYGYELDYNNNYKDINVSSGHAAYGMGITGAGDHLSSAALLITGLGNGGTTPIWYRGILFANDSIEDYAIEDQTDAGTSIRITGTKSGWGIDMGEMVGDPLRIGNNRSIMARNAANTDDEELIGLSSDDDIFIGSFSPQTVIIGNDTNRRARFLNGGGVELYDDSNLRATIDDYGLTITGTGDVDLTDGQNPFNIGATTGAHMALDANEIQAKSNATTATNLIIQGLGGDASIGAQTGSGDVFLYENGNIAARTWPAGSGGFLVDNQLTGGPGMERVLTVSDIASGALDHTDLASIGTNTHAQIDTHLALTDEHIDWTVDAGGTDIHQNNISQASVTQHQGAIDHGSLAGTGDDDHTIYSRVDGSRDFTGQTLDIAYTGSGEVDFTIRNSEGGVQLTTNAGNANIRATDSAGVSGDTYINMAEGGAVSLYNDNDIMLRTTTNGIDVLNPNDSNALLDVVTTQATRDAIVGLRSASFGTRLTHDEASDNFYIQTTTAAGTVLETMAIFKKDAEVELLYDDTTRFETTSVGADVLGTILEVDNSGDASATELRIRNSEGGIRVYTDGNDLILATTDTAYANGQVGAISNRDASFDMFNNGKKELATKDSDADYNTVGAEVRHHDDSFYDVGIMPMPVVEQDTAVTLDETHVGKVLHRDGTSSITFTLPSGTSGAVPPVGSKIMIINENATGVLTISASGTLRYMSGGGVSSGDMELANGGVCTVYHYANAEWWIWGDGVSAA